MDIGLPVYNHFTWFWEGFLNGTGLKFILYSTAFAAATTGSTGTGATAAATTAAASTAAAATAATAATAAAAVAASAHQHPIGWRRGGGVESNAFADGDHLGGQLVSGQPAGRQPRPPLWRLLALPPRPAPVVDALGLLPRRRRSARSRFHFLFKGRPSTYRTREGLDRAKGHSILFFVSISMIGDERS